MKLLYDAPCRIDSDDGLDSTASSVSSNVFDAPSEVLLLHSLSLLNSSKIDLKVLLFDRNVRIVLITVAADAFPACKQPKYISNLNEEAQRNRPALNLVGKKSDLIAAETLKHHVALTSL